MSKSKAAQGAGTIRQRSNGKWEARVVVGVNPGTGKPIRRSIYADTQKEVRRQMTAILRELDSGTYQAPNKIKVSDWMQEWLTTFCEGKVKPLTMQTYSRPYQEPYQPGHWCYGTASGQGYSYPEAIQLHDKGRPFREAGAECFRSPA